MKQLYQVDEIMYKTFYIVALMCLFASCGGRRDVASERQPLERDTVQMDSMDTLFSSQVEKKIFPNVDGVFEDFFSLFLTDESFQNKRIHFPLPYSTGGCDTALSSEGWKNASMLPSEVGLYASIYEREADMMLEGDTALHSVLVEFVCLDQEKIVAFKFERPDTEWQLVGIVENGLDGYVHESFVRFYHRFTSDSLYQSVHVQDPLVFVTSDPEDDFKILKATIGREQWFAFRPFLPTGMLMNINYAIVPSTSVSRSRILQLKNIGSGSITNLYFRLRLGEWQLVRLEDTGN